MDGYISHLRAFKIEEKHNNSLSSSFIARGKKLFNFRFFVQLSLQLHLTKRFLGVSRARSGVNFKRAITSLGFVLKFCC